MNYPARSRGPSFETDENGFACLHGGAAKLATATLIIGLSLGAAEADQPGGKFGFPYPNFSGAPMTPQQFKDAKLYFDNLEFSIPAAIDASGMK